MVLTWRRGGTSSQLCQTELKPSSDDDYQSNLEQSYTGANSIVLLTMPSGDGSPSPANSDNNDDHEGSVPPRAREYSQSVTIGGDAEIVKSKGGRRPSTTIWAHTTPLTSRQTILDCCGAKIAKHATKIKRHFLSCPSFRTKFPQSFRELQAPGGAVTTSAGVAVGSSSCAGLTAAASGMLMYDPCARPEKKARLDASFSIAVLKSGMSLSACQGPEFQPFWQEVFNGSWKPPDRRAISTTHLASAYDDVQREVRECMGKSLALGCSVDGYGDASRSSVLNLVFYAPIPFHVGSLRLSARETSMNLDELVSAEIAAVRKGIPRSTSPLPEVFGLVSDNPNVMTFFRRLISGATPGGTASIRVAYGCACHALDNFVKDALSLAGVKELLKNTCLIATYLKNSRLARAELAKERKKQQPPTRTIKTFSLTRWNGFAAMLTSVVENKEPIRSMFARESLKDEEDCLLDVHKPDSKAAKARALCSTAPYWTSLTMYQPLFETFSSVIALLEGDLTPLSLVLPSFRYLLDAVESSGVPTSVKSGMREALISRYQSIGDDVHVLALVLDPCLPHGHWDGLEDLLGGESVAVAASRCLDELLAKESIQPSAMKKEANMSEQSQETARGQLNMILAGYAPSTMTPDRFHPLTWWRSRSSSSLADLRIIAEKVLVLPCSSAGVERSFRVRSRVHGKTRNRLGNASADMQSYVVYNAGQARRFVDGVHARQKRDSHLEIAIRRGMAPARADGTAEAALIGSGAQGRRSSESDEHDDDDEDDFDNPIDLLVDFANFDERLTEVLAAK